MLNRFDECELVVFISTIACCIAKESTDEELEFLATVLSQLGDTLDTIVAQRQRRLHCKE